ncbi:type I-E CRISPR-associated protein Cas6/Cse3/CasE [Streptomyces sp. A0642]|uniref:type I-E CRISPR-associated protein Cas6/Cse3/CasE n=1 Tax=Streptomyces sp. A0642 TaxID=2563100 RepID=UPI0010A23711|nr:type I-E CRISPR-associated protein Cas6/Cse3/CasE [Streptomyces sp. A0642]THA69363.1 type I-E CRISPR-associated protein Cas6/Cse3/CasE [Streptomyces sp. A0642]
MYLTRAYINPRRQGAIRLIGNPRALHALIMGCFPDQTPTSPGQTPPRILWRLDSDDTRRPTLWTVSPTRPDFTQLIEDAGWPAAETPQWETKPYTPLLNHIQKGQRYAFRLTAFPTRRTASPGPNQRGRRLPHTTTHNQLRWLTERAERNGFTIPPAGNPDDLGPDGEIPLQLQLRHRGKNTFNKPDHQDKRIRVALTTATYEGALHVTNPDALRTLLTTGIGQGRAYGCGLLTLARLPEPTQRNGKAIR